MVVDNAIFSTENRQGETDDEESLEIDDEDEWKELEELKSEFKPLAKSMDDECVAVRVHV